MNVRVLILALALVAAAAAVAACGGEDGAQTTPAVVPTATPSGERDGADGFRAFVAEIDESTRQGDVSFFMDRLKTEPVVCTEDMVPPEMGEPACTVVGERFDGFPLSFWRSEGALVPAPQIEEQLRGRFFGAVLPGASDEFGTGDATAYAINAEGGRYAALLTAIIARPADFAGSGPLRVVIHTAWEYDGARWRMTAMMNAYVLGEEFLRPDDVVRSYYPQWERYAPP